MQFNHMQIHPNPVPQKYQNPIPFDHSKREQSGAFSALHATDTNHKNCQLKNGITLLFAPPRNTGCLPVSTKTLPIRVPGPINPNGKGLPSLVDTQYISEVPCSDFLLLVTQP